MAQTIGLEAKLDITQFNRDVKTYVKAVEEMTKATQEVAGATSQSVKSAARDVGKFGISWSRVRDIITGITVIDVFRGISNAVKGAASEAYSAVESFQRLNIQLEALAARDYAKQFGGSVGDAFGKVQGQARELLLWIRRIAVTTPFSVETITSAIAFGQAFGFSTEQAKRLTLATGNFTAGMGLTNEHLERIIYNFGQMLASGRILGRELRDLANNFVPVNDVIQIMADRAGVTFNQMREDMRKGLIPAADFINTFVELAEQDFPDAMDRMARTLSGVRQNIQDFIQTLFGLEILGPVMDTLAAKFAGFIDAAFQPQIIRYFAAVGLAINNAFKIIDYTVSNELIPSIKAFFSALGANAPTALDFASIIIKAGIAIQFFVKTLAAGINAISRVIGQIRDYLVNAFEGLDVNMEAWGRNIIIAFAKGMADAVRYVIQVITAIARAISNFLRAKSPPKILPDLPKWGAAAMQSYLDGWGSADFNIFNEIAGTIASYIRALSAKIPETDIIPRILGARSAIAALVEQVRKTGDYTSEALNKIFKAAKISSGALKDYIAALVDFTAVSAKIKEVEKIFDFDFTKKIPVKIFGEVVNNIDDLRKAANKLTGDLRTRVLAYVDAMYALSEANRRVEETQKQIADATEHYSDVLDDLQKQLTKVTTFEDEEARIRAINQAIGTGLLTKEEKRRLELELQEIQIKRNIRAVEDERDTVIDALEDKLKLQQEERDALKETAELQLALAKQIADEQLAAAKEQYDAAKALVDVQIENNRLMSEQLELLKRLAEAAKAGGAGGLEPPDLGSFEGLGQDLQDALEDAGEGLQEAIDQLQKDLQAEFNTFIEELTAPFRDLSPEISAAWASAVDLFYAIRDDVSAFAQSEEFGLIKQAFIDFGASISEGIQNIRTFWEQNAPGFLEVVQNFFQRLGEALGIEPGELGTVALGAVLEILDGVGQAIVGFTELLIENGPKMQEALQGFVDWIFDTALPKLQEFIDWLGSDSGQQMLKFAAILAGMAASALLAGKVLSFVFGKLLGGLGGQNLVFIIPFIEALIKGFTAIGGVGGLVSTVLGGIGSILSALAPILAVIAAIVGVVVVAFIAWKNNIAGFQTVMRGVWESMKKTLAPAIEELIKAWKEMQPALKKAQKSMEPIIKVVKFLGAALFYGLVVILRTVITTIAALVTALIKGLAKAISYFSGIASIIIDGFAKIIDGVTSFVTGLWDVIAGIFTGDWQRVLSGLGAIGEGIITVFAGLFQSVIGIFTAGFAFIIGLVQGFVEGFIQFFVNLYYEVVGGSIIPDMVNSMIEWFVTLFSTILEDLTEWIKTFLSDITKFGTDLFNKAKEAWQKFLTGTSEKFTEIWENVKQWIQDMLQLILDRYEDIKTMAIDMWEKFRTGVEDKFKTIWADVKEWLQDMLDLISDRYEDIKQYAIDLWQKFLDGVKDKFFGPEGIITKVGDWMGEILDTIDEYYDDFVTAGKDIIAGLIQGLLQKAGDLYAQVRKIIQNAISGGKKESKTESPSKVFAEMGINWMLGLEQGIKSRAAKTVDLIQKVVRDFQSPMQDLGNFNVNAPNMNRMMFAQSPMSGGIPNFGGSQNIDKSVHVEVNPTYKNFESEASVRYDVSAALNAVVR